jgi:hypothetical protein
MATAHRPYSLPKAAKNWGCPRAGNASPRSTRAGVGSDENFPTAFSNSLCRNRESPHLGTLTTAGKNREFWVILGVMQDWQSDFAV